MRTKIKFNEVIEDTNIIPLSFFTQNNKIYYRWKCTLCNSEHITEDKKFQLKIKYYKKIRRKMCCLCNNNIVKIGDKLGKITILDFIIVNGYKSWKYKCDCGNIGIRRANYIVNAIINKRYELFTCGKCNTQKSRHIHYKRAGSILERCNNKKHKSYNDYGGRGIKCLLGETIVEVIESLEKVPGYFQGLQIDRIDNNGDYTLYHPEHGYEVWYDEYGNPCKGNLRWVCPELNSSNRRSSITLESLASKGRPTDLFHKILSKKRSKLLGWKEEDFIREFSHVHISENDNKTSIYYFYIHKSLLN